MVRAKYTVQTLKVVLLYLRSTKKGETMDYVVRYIHDYISFLQWRDYLEIIFFVYGSYQTFAWLGNGASRKLLKCIYTYLVILIGSYCIALPTLFIVLIAIGPILAVFTVITHQDVVTKHLITPARSINIKECNWAEELIKASLKSMNSGIKIICVIQKNDNLAQFLQPSIYISCKLNAAHLGALIESKNFNSQEIIYVQADGTLLGINGTWTFGGQDSLHDISFTKACAVSAKNDCIAFKTNPDNNSFDIAVKNNIAKNISSSGLRTILTTYLVSAKGVTYEKPMA